MTYEEYLKEKFINLYLINQKIGKHSVTINDFNFLDIAFSKMRMPIKPYTSEIEQLFSYVVKNFEDDLVLKNKIGIDFLEILNQERKLSNIFLQQTPLKQVQITTEQKEKLVEKYTKVANKYGLKEFYYSLDPLLNPEENFNKALLLLDKTKEELNKLQQSLEVKESHKIGNYILSIQLNSPAENIQGGYNPANNTICLKDENSTFPLIHEYVHFIDKTTAALLLTGKTTQQLYEIEEKDTLDKNFIDRNSKEYATLQKNRKYSEKELKELFDMSIFTQIGHKKEGTLWTIFKQTILVSILNKEINQNKYIQEVFNQNLPQEYNVKEFKQIIFDWIEEKNYPNKELLKNDINNIFESRELNKIEYSQNESQVLERAKLFKKYKNEENYFMNFSKAYDIYNSQQENKSFVNGEFEFFNDQINKYYQTQKEMLARAIEQTINGKHEQLSDRLTTPQLSEEEKQRFFEIIKSWQNITHELLKQQKKQNTSNMVQKVIGKFREFKNKEIEKEFKLK